MEYDKKVAQQLVECSCNAQGNFSWNGMPLVSIGGPHRSHQAPPEFLKLFRDFAKPARLALTDTLEDAAEAAAKAEPPKQASAASLASSSSSASPATPAAPPPATAKADAPKQQVKPAAAAKKADPLAEKYPARWRAVQDAKDMSVALSSMSGCLLFLAAVDSCRLLPFAVISLLVPLFVRSVL